MGPGGVIVIGVRYRADKADFVCHSRKLGHKFGNTYAWSLTADGVEWTAKLGGSIGLHIEKIDVAWTSPHI